MYAIKGAIIDTRVYELEIAAHSMLLPFYGSYCTFFGLSVSASSSLCHSLVEIQQHLAMDISYLQFNITMLAIAAA